MDGDIRRATATEDLTMGDELPKAEVTGSWCQCAAPGVRCDKTLADPSLACSAAITIGAPMWVEERRYGGSWAHKSFAVVTCEQCRLLEIAHEWANAADVPPHAIHKTNRRGLAGRHLLTPEQYERTARAASAMIDAATKPGKRHNVPDAPTGHAPEAALVARESRKVRHSSARDNRGQLAG